MRGQLCIVMPSCHAVPPCQGTINNRAEQYYIPSSSCKQNAHSGILPKVLSIEISFYYCSSGIPQKGSWLFQLFEHILYTTVYGSGPRLLFVSYLSSDQIVFSNNQRCRLGGPMRNSRKRHRLLPHGTYLCF